MRCLGIDIGAESGRALLGELSGSQLTLTEVSRVSNTPIRVDESLRWNLPELVSAVRAAADACSGIDSVGIVTWGVDFVLLTADGKPLELPYHYRDHRTDGVMERVWHELPKREIYAITGTQFLKFNSLFQLIAAQNLPEASRFLLIPDYLLFSLNNGVLIGCEYTNAMTTQCMNAHTQTWDQDLLIRFGINPDLFPPIVPTGTILGESNGVKIIAPACHDTASAAIAAHPGSAWLSSGTWSILGINTDEPILSSEALASNFTNEGSATGRFRLCKNVMGLWLLQELRREWGLQGTGYANLTEIAREVKPCGQFFNVDAPSLLAPKCMSATIASELTQWNQRVPQSRGEWIRVVLESLALKYRFVLDRLEKVSGQKVESINIIGGGSQNEVLNQLTADICGRPVIAGPTEATALGNLMVQFTSLGAFGSLQEAQAFVRASTSCRIFEKRESAMWDDQYARYLRHLEPQ